MARKHRNFFFEPVTRASVIATDRAAGKKCAEVFLILAYVEAANIRPVGVTTRRGIKPRDRGASPTGIISFYFARR